MDRLIVVSDLHVGLDGPYNIFAGRKAFPAFAQTLRHGDHLVLNGDAVDFLLDDGPLDLDGAVQRARDIASGEDGQAVFEALAAAAGRGVEITLRVGNHDPETSLPDVQEVFREAAGGTLGFDTGEVQVEQLGGVRIAMAHGEHTDHWNAFNRDKLSRGGDDFRFPPGSKLVKTLLNKVKSQYEHRFADLLKPDVEGALMTVLALEPTALSMVLQPGVREIAWQLRKRLRGSADDFVEGVVPGAPEGPTLDQAATDVLLQLLSEDEAGFFGEIADEVRSAWLRFGLSVWARAQRRAAGDAGKEFFDLEPELTERMTAVQVDAVHQTPLVILGHTHAARLGQFGGLTIANSGTWIPLMRLPDADADIEEWTRLLSDLRADPDLDGVAKGRIIHRFTTVRVEPSAVGVDVHLDQQSESGRTTTLRSKSVPRA